jgi:fluoride exporter
MLRCQWAFALLRSPSASRWPNISGEPGASAMSKVTKTINWNAAILYGCVAAGGMLGSVARYLAGLLIPLMSGFPLATLFVNVTGSFIIGFYATLTGPDGRWLVSTRQRQFVMTGFCGGYTTFSAFSLETFKLLHAGMKATALTNIGVSVVTWLVAVWLGYAVASRLNRLKGS